MSFYDEERYEDATIYRFVRSADPDALVPTEEMRALAERVRAGRTEGGRPLKGAAYVFEHRALAEYNADALAFSGLGCRLGVPGDHRAIKGASFGTKEDFGIS